MPQVQEDRPPYVVFAIHALEDRDASITKGHYVTKDVAFAHITPMGSKDQVEVRADEWFAQLAADVEQGRFKREWLLGYKDSFKAWEEGRDPNVEGTSVLLWPILSPSQLQACQQARVRSVEDIAAANEETLSRLGMGARALKQRAIDWLAASQNTGKVSEELSSLKVKVEELTTANGSLQSKVAELETALAAAKAALPAAPDSTTAGGARKL